MRYTVREAIDKLNQLIEQNPKIADAILGVYTNDEYNDDFLNTTYDLDIEIDGFYDADGKGGAQFTFGEHIDYDEYDNDDEDDY